MIYLVGLFNALILATLFSCSVPDLSDPEILLDAQKEAIPLESLERKLMYGMIPLYVDQTETLTAALLKSLMTLI